MGLWPWPLAFCHVNRLSPLTLCPLAVIIRARQEDQPVLLLRVHAPDHGHGLVGLDHDPGCVDASIHADRSQGHGHELLPLLPLQATGRVHVDQDLVLAKDQVRASDGHVTGLRPELTGVKAASAPLSSSTDKDVMASLIDSGLERVPRPLALSRGHLHVSEQDETKASICQTRTRTHCNVDEVTSWA